MQTFMKKTAENHCSKLFFFFWNAPTVVNAMQAHHADCAPATDLVLPPTPGPWVEGQSG